MSVKFKYIAALILVIGGVVILFFEIVSHGDKDEKFVRNLSESMRNWNSDEVAGYFTKDAIIEFRWIHLMDNFLAKNSISKGNFLNMEIDGSMLGKNKQLNADWSLNVIIWTNHEWEVDATLFLTGTDSQRKIYKIKSLLWDDEESFQRFFVWGFNDLNER